MGRLSRRKFLDRFAQKQPLQFADGAVGGGQNGTLGCERHAWSGTGEAELSQRDHVAINQCERGAGGPAVVLFAVAAVEGRDRKSVV